VIFIMHSIHNISGYVILLFLVWILCVFFEKFRLDWIIGLGIKNTILYI